MIAYKTIIEVFLNSKKVGEIRPCTNGFYYQPDGSKQCGEIFVSVEKVKESLQAK
jgi:hypothetical protein